jgi:hypothetical protein
MRLQRKLCNNSFQGYTIITSQWLLDHHLQGLFQNTHKEESLKNPTTLYLAYPSICSLLKQIYLLTIPLGERPNDFSSPIQESMICWLGFWMHDLDKESQGFKHWHSTTQFVRKEMDYDSYWLSKLFGHLVFTPSGDEPTMNAIMT